MSLCQPARSSQRDLGSRFMGSILMSERELHRIEVLSEVVSRSRAQLASAAIVLSLSVRQVQRIVRTILCRRLRRAASSQPMAAGRTTVSMTACVNWRCSWCANATRTLGRRWPPRSWLSTDLRFRARRCASGWRTPAIWSSGSVVCVPSARLRREELWPS